MATYPDRAAPGEDGTVRKAHYGDGRQPWDDIRDAGWAPAFAAGCVLRYLRRAKDREHSIESARWYWERLNALCATEHGDPVAVLKLHAMLTPEERDLIGAPASLYDQENPHF